MVKPETTELARANPARATSARATSARANGVGAPVAGTPNARTPLDADLLIEFFDQHGRDLPWRRPEASPWAVLVSEVMLQQTPVVRVLTVYERWLAAWPTPADLAADSPAAAIRAWERLGYPRRALRLHAAATAITIDHDGDVPSSVAELLTLPGIGEYTARAVAAFAFGARTPVVDTNVRRVLTRAVRGLDEPREPATAADRAEMDSLLPQPPARAARFSAAVMELGALVCSARAPACGSCPLADRCRWRLAGSVAGEARRAVQTWHGTDRQVRGRIMAALRGSPAAVSKTELTGAAVDQEQARRCLASLLADGLAVTVGAAHVGLPD